MLSMAFLVFAIVHLLVWIYGWRAWVSLGRPIALTLFLIANTLLWYDNFRIGMGRFIGEGSLLYAMSVPAFVWHWTMLPLLVIVAGSIARLADFYWARKRAVMGAFCVAAIGLMALDLPYAISLLFGQFGPLPVVELRPGCIADTLRYTTAVSPGQFCTADAQVLRTGPGPKVAIIMNFLMIALGAALWMKRSWKWLVIGPGLMFIAAGGAPLWGIYALPVANFGEILFTLGVLATILHFAKLKQAQGAGVAGSDHAVASGASARSTMRGPASAGRLP